MKPYDAWEAGDKTKAPPTKRTPRDWNGAMVGAGFGVLGADALVVGLMRRAEARGGRGVSEPGVAAIRG